MVFNCEEFFDTRSLLLTLLVHAHIVPIRCHTHSVSKGVILRIHIPYTLAKQKHREQTNSANGTRRSKVTKVESFMIETEATELKHKDFVVALYLMGMHDNKAEELARSHKHPFAIENSTFSGMRLYAGWD